VAAKIHANSNAVLQSSFVGESFDNGSSTLDVKEAHLEALIGEHLIGFF
jgi:hypothetical protein